MMIPTAAQRPTAARTPLTRFLTLLAHVLAGLLLLRVALIYFGANIDQPVVALLLAVTQPLAGMFEGIFPQPSDEAGILPVDLGAIIAAAAIEGFAKLVRVVAGRALEVP